jgi:hypothetical protein
MERLENLTMDQLVEAEAKATNEGYKESSAIENVPVGAVSGKPVLMSVKLNGKTTKSPNFAIIPFVRKTSKGEEVKLFFKGVKYNVTHLSSGKSYNDIYTKATEEIKEALTNPVNFTKETLFDSVAYGTAGRTILKFQSIG